MDDSLKRGDSILYHQLISVAANYAEKSAIVSGNRSISYNKLVECSADFRKKICNLVDTPVLGLLVSNPIDFMVAYFGLAASGKKVVLLDPRSSVSEIHSCALELGFRSVVTSPVESCTLQNILHLEIKTESSVFGIVEVDSAKDILHDHYIVEDFVVHCTSGSTGKPKGIVLSEENVLARVDSWSRTLNITADDVLLCTLTLAHCHGIEIITLPGLLSGATVVAPELSSLTPRKVAALIADNRVTIFSTLPFIYDLLLEALKPEEAYFESVRLFVAASAALPINTAISFFEKFGHLLHQAYGLSEIGGICFNRSAIEPDLIGEPAYGLELRLEASSVAGHGHELLVRGPGLARGYINADDQDTFRDGWLWTKDIVEKQEGGFRVIGRASRFINSAGNKVIPQEVEDQIRRCESVVDVVVAGQPDPIEGEIVVAFVQWRSDPNLAEVRDRLAANLAGYKLPREIISVVEMPRGNIGKVSVKELFNLRTSRSLQAGQGGVPQ